VNTVSESNKLAKEMCSKDTKYRYLYGGKGQKYTSALVRQLASAYPSFYDPIKYAMEDADKGYLAIDCSGFVCKVLGITSAGSSGLKSNAVKRLSVTKANAKPGMVLWKQGHVAYVGEDLKIYEAAGTTIDLKVSTWDKRAGAFSLLLICKGSALSVTPCKTTVDYYPKCTLKSNSIIDCLASIGEKDTSLKHRKVIANANNIKDYSGTATQNKQLRLLLQEGRLVKA